MKKLVLILTSVFLFILGGCNKENKNTEKTLTISTGAKPKSLDPSMNNEIPSLQIAKQIFNTLFTLDNNGMIQPELAESYTYISPKELEITIKKGIKFHNGEELTVDDVVFSINRMLEKPATKIMLEAIESCTAIGSNKIKITLKESSSPLLYTLSYPLTSILNKKDTISKKDNISINPMGTGPFKLIDWGDGEKIQLEAHEEYFQGKANVDKLIFRGITENTSRLAALETGELDIATIAPIDVDLVNNNKELYAVSYSTTSTEFLGVNNEKYPFNNIDFRKAIHHAINKQSIVDAVYMGMASPAKSIVNPTVFGSNQSVKGYEYSLEKAKSYLEKSGIKDIKIGLISNDNPVRLQAAQIIQANLKDIGIDVVIETLEWGTYLQYTSQGKHNMFIGGWVSGTSDSDIVLYPLLHSTYHGGAGNKSFYTNKEYDSYVELGRTETDLNKRKEAYYKAQEILDVETPIIPLYYKNDNLGLSKKIKNFKSEANTIHSYKNIEKGE